MISELSGFDVAAALVVMVALFSFLNAWLEAAADRCPRARPATC